MLNFWYTVILMKSVWAVAIVPFYSISWILIQCHVVLLHVRRKKDTTPRSSPACSRKKRYCYFSFGSKCHSLFSHIVSTHVSDICSVERKKWATCCLDVRTIACEGKGRDKLQQIQCLNSCLKFPWHQVVGACCVWPFGKQCFLDCLHVMIGEAICFVGSVVLYWYIIIKVQLFCHCLSLFLQIFS